MNLPTVMLNVVTGRLARISPSATVMALPIMGTKAKNAISAATLSALTFFNQDKLPFLLDAYLINDPILSPRALVGYVLSYLASSDCGGAGRYYS